MASPSTSSPASCVVLGDSPHQPKDYNFPKRSFGKKTLVYRSFQSCWFASWKWLHYLEAEDITLCFLCLKAKEKGVVVTSNLGSCDQAFLSRGFSNWKDATVAFRKHEQSACHKLAIDVLVTVPETVGNVGEMLVNSLAQERASNRHCLLLVMESLKFLARQGCAIQGHTEKGDGNLYQLLTLRSSSDTKLQEWLKRKSEAYLSHEVQNEMLKLMSLNTLRKIVCDLQATEFVTIMLDECADISNKEQVVLVLRWVDKGLEVHEEFIGLYSVSSITSSALFAVVKDSFLRLNISFSKVRGQCYDGASNMSGRRSGLAKKIIDEQPLAFYTHCYGHSLNLAVSDLIKNSSTMKRVLDIAHEITKLVKYSPRRESLFRDIKDEISPSSPGIRVLCPTRWTVKADTLKSIICNYSTLQELWDQAVEIVQDSDTTARIGGIAAQMKLFDFYFGLVIGENLLRITDNLSQTLQKKNYSAIEGQVTALQTKKTLMHMRSEESFDLLWKKVDKMRLDKDVGDPMLPRKRRCPVRLEDGMAPPEYDSCPKLYYRRIYYEAVDILIQSIEDRFDQEGYIIYSVMESLFLKLMKKEDYQQEFRKIAEVYGNDLNVANLETQLHVLSSNIPEDVHDMHSLKKYFQHLSSAERELMCEVVCLLKIILVMPATNCTSERSFSALRRLKTYLRSTMSQERLNSLMILHVHKDYTDNMILSDVANDFISGRERRSNVFGKF